MSATRTKKSVLGLAYDKEKDVAGKYGIVGRNFIGTQYEAGEIDAAAFARVRWKPKGYYLAWSKSDDDSLNDPPEGHVESTPHGRSIIRRGVILKPVETIQVGDRKLLIDGRDRWYFHEKYGIPCPIEVVEGLRIEDVADYIVEINSARGRPTIEDRKAQVRHYIDAEEARFGAGEIARRSAYNKIATICDVSHSSVKKIERDCFRATRWADACKGEERESLNRKRFWVREEDPEKKIAGLSSKLAPNANATRSERETSIKLIRDLLRKYKDLLGQSYIKGVEGDVQVAESFFEKERDEEDRRRRRAEEQPSVEPERLVRERRATGVAEAGPGREPYEPPLVIEDGGNLGEGEGPDEPAETRAGAFSGIMAGLFDGCDRTRKAAKSIGWDEVAGEPEERDGYLRERYRMEDDLFQEMGLGDEESDRLREAFLVLMNEIHLLTEERDPDASDTPTGSTHRVGT